MSAIAKSRPGGRAGSPGVGRKNQKVILIVLSVVLLAVLAFELPKLLKGSSSPSASATIAVTTTAVVAVGAAPVDTTGAAPALSPAQVAAAERSINKLHARDPFTPLASDAVSTTPSSSPAPTAPAASTTPTATATTPATTPGSVSAASAATTPAASTVPPTVAVTPAPAVVPKVVPTQAVIWTSLKRQVIDLRQVFAIGDTSFRLVAVNRTRVEIAVVGGVFTGGKPTMTILRTKPVTLVNTATGVRYPIRFSLAASGLTATPTPAPTPTAAPLPVPTPVVPIPVPTPTVSTPAVTTPSTSPATAVPVAPAPTTTSVTTTSGK